MAEHSFKSTGGPGQLARLDADAIKSLAARCGNNIPAPGYMAQDDCKAYLAQIYNLFPGVDQVEVEMTLAKWCILHDVGGEQGHAEKPPIEAGGISVPANRVFGEVIPSDRRGLPRQFAATMFEKMVPVILDACPEIRAALTPRAIERGSRAGDEVFVVSFVKGGVPGSTASHARAKAKRVGVTRSPPVVSSPAEPYVSEVPRSAPPAQDGRPSYF